MTSIFAKPAEERECSAPLPVFYILTAVFPDPMGIDSGQLQTDDAAVGCQETSAIFRSKAARSTVRGLAVVAQS